MNPLSNVEDAFFRKERPKLASLLMWKLRKSMESKEAGTLTADDLYKAAGIEKGDR